MRENGFLSLEHSFQRFLLFCEERRAEDDASNNLSLFFLFSLLFFFRLFFSPEMADSLSIKPLSLGPMTASLGGPSRNPFASFAKGAGASLNPVAAAAAAAAAAATSSSAIKSERKKKNPADVVSFDTEFLMGFAKVRERGVRSSSVIVLLAFGASRERQRDGLEAETGRRKKKRKNVGPSIGSFRRRPTDSNHHHHGALPLRGRQISCCRRHMDAEGDVVPRSEVASLISRGVEEQRCDPTSSSSAGGAAVAFVRLLRKEKEKKNSPLSLPLPLSPLSLSSPLTLQLSPA